MKEQIFGGLVCGLRSQDIGPQPDRLDCQPVMTALGHPSRNSLGGNWGYPPRPWSGKFGQGRVNDDGKAFAQRDGTNGVSSRSCVEKKGLVLAPRVGLEPTTLRLTADPVVAA